MSPIVLEAVGPAADIAAIVILIFSIRELLRKSFAGSRWLKEGLLAGEILYGCIFALDLVRNLDIYPAFVQIYSVVGGSLVIWGALFLSFVAYVVYVRPLDYTFRGILRSLFFRSVRPHGLIISGMAVYVCLFTLYLVVARPYMVMNVTNPLGVSSEAPAFGNGFLLFGAGLLIFFIAYPVQALLSSRAKAVDPAVRRAAAIVPVSWTIIGNIFLVSGVLLPRVGIDTLPFGFLAIAVTITWASVSFRNASVSTFFFTDVRASTSPTFPFSSGVKGAGSSPLVGTILLEFEPSTNYEEAVDLFAREQISNGRPLFVFTRRGSPVLLSLLKIPEVRFLVQSQGSSVQEGDLDNREMIIPQDSLSAILNSAGKVLETETHLAKSLVFDSLSNLILDFGIQGTYKFFRQMNEMSYKSGATVLFLMLSNTHELSMRTLMESLSPTILTYDKEGLKALRLSKGIHQG